MLKETNSKSVLRTDARLENAKVVEQHVPCDECDSSDAKCVYEDGHSYCFSCNTYTPPTKFVEDAFTYEFLPFRGIAKEIFQFYGAKTRIDAEGKPIRIEYPHVNGSLKIRALPKGFYYQGDVSKVGLFGRDKFPAGSAKTITITEGYEDALSLYQILRSPVVSVKSSGSAWADCSLDRAYLNSFDRIYLAFDADEPGREAAAKVAKLFDYNKLYDVRFEGGNRKDANDYLQRGEIEQLRAIWNNAKKFLPDNIVSSVSDFEKIITTPLKEGIPYPFPTWTTMTKGIRTGETVLITAPTGVGKTDVLHAIEHNILKETDHGVAAFYLEESKQWHLRAIAGLELGRYVQHPDSGCSDSEVIAALKQVVPTDDRLFVYSHYGSDDPEVLLDAVRFVVSARGCRYVAFDNISVACTGLGGKDEREALDYLSNRLNMMTQELDFGLIMASHENDNGETRGSRMIGYNCHVRIRLSRDQEADDDRVKRTTRTVIKKNRPASMTGFAGDLVFDPVTHKLSEDIYAEQSESPSIVPKASDTLGWGKPRSQVSTKVY